MGNICIIGPRNSGKTTYLAGLSYFSESCGSRSRYNVQPGNDDSRDLIDKAEDIVLQGSSLEPNVLGDRIYSVDDLPDYFFHIEVKGRLFKPATVIQLNVRDYPGEVFEKILYVDEEDSIHQEFIDECLRSDVVGCLLLFTEWESNSDRFYSKLMSRFLELMDERDRLNNYRLAVAMSKCERGEIWPGRIDPETDLFGIYLKKTLQTLRQGLPPANLKFYALSTFGVLGRYDPRPNRINEFGSDGRASVLRDPPRWNPYNLIDPLYWLSTGKG